MSNKIFCLNFELLFAVICLIWLADHLLMKGLSLNFRLSDFTSHKIAWSSKIEKTKKIFAPAQSKVALAVSIKEKSSEDFIARSMQWVECNPQIRHITKDWNHLTLKTHCKNKELIYCISGGNASEKELDLQINWYWINMRNSPERLNRCSLRSKRFRAVKTEERDSRFWPREKWNERQKMKEGEGFLPFFANPSPLTRAIFREAFAPKQHGNACLAGYNRYSTRLFGTARVDLRIWDLTASK